MNFELDWLKYWNQIAPDRVVLRDPAGDLNLTYADLYRTSNAIARQLRKAGIRKGDRVAVLAKNSWFYVNMLFGAQRAGAILVPISFRLAKPEVEYILADAEPALILVEEEFYDHISPGPKVRDWKGFSETVLGDDRTETVEFSTDAEDPCLILYTSGTTGRAKGAIVNHRMLFWNSINTSIRLDISADDIQPSFAPLFHTGGWNVLLTPFLHRGGKSILLEKFEPERILDLCEKEQITMFFGVPTMLDQMARSPKFATCDLSSLRFVVVGGEPMPLSLIRRWEEKGVRIRQGYGLTEFGPNVFSLNEQDSVRKIGSIGYPNFYVETRVIDNEGRDVAAGQVGELWLRGPAGTPGYWRNPKATEDLYCDGWLKTGDLVKSDDEGYFYVIGRKKEMFISGGENVYPAEVEQALRTHPEVLEAAVIGIPDEKWGESGKAFVVRKAGSRLDENGILEYCRGHLARFKVPKSVAFLASLPKSDSGKILKRDLQSKTIIPADHQPELPLSKFILEKKPEGDDVVPFDVVFVGAGPAGLAGAIELAKLAKADPSVGPIEIGVLEKASSLGGHSLSGAVVNPVAFRELFPNLKETDFPFRRKVSSEKVYMMTSAGKIRIPTPPTMKNHGYYTASLSEIVRWLGQKAEAAGINILTSFAVDSLLMQGSRVVGVETTPAGLKRDGQPGAGFMPPTQISAQVVALSEGTRGPLGQAYRQKMQIGSKTAQIFALGVKEVWKVKKAPSDVIHTLGWPLPRDAFGGSFLYPLADDLVSFGLVVGLDYRSTHLDVHQLLQKMKQHPLFREILDGGECVEWGAKTIPEGGFHALPEKFCGDGLVMMGDTVGFVNVPALKGIHYAMMSGILAARAIFKALKEKNTGAESLQAYDFAVRESFIWRDLREVRNMRHAFKSGFFFGGIKAALMTASKGAFPGGGHAGVEDAREPKVVDDKPPFTGGLSKVDGVYRSGNKTRDDIPQHLLVGRDVTAEVADFYTHVCPAGVYERRGETLVVNAPNCVDCKATDVFGPRWTPREGGSGPDYKLM